MGNYRGERTASRRTHGPGTGRWLVTTWGAGPALVVAVLALARPAVVAPLDLAVYDILLRSAAMAPPSGEVVIVDVDESSLSALGQWPWPRDLMARLVDRVRDHGARTVGLDIVFAEPDRYDQEASGHPAVSDGLLTTTDRTLAHSLSTGGVVLGYAMLFDELAPGADRCVLPPLGIPVVRPRGSHGPDAWFEATGVVCNLPGLARAAGAAGFLNAAPDSDGILRRVPLVMGLGAAQYPSLGLAVYLAATKQTDPVLEIVDARSSWLALDDQVRVPLDGRGHLLLRFRGPRRSLPYVSALDVLEGRAPAAEALRDRIVLIGTTALGTRDVVSTPVDTLFAGVEVQATVVDNLVQRDFVRRTVSGGLVEAVAAIGLGLVLGGVTGWRGLRWGSAVAVLSTGAIWVGATHRLTETGWFFSPAYPTVAAGLGYVTSLLACFRVERRRASGAAVALREAHTDGLTGVPNRRAFEQHFAEEFDQAGRDRPLSVLFADVDHFKRFNDLHGHPVGDQVLVAFARALDLTTGDRGRVFRVGGEEFAVVCPVTSVESSDLAEELLQAVRRQARVADDRGGTLNVTCSIGIATHDGERFERRDGLLKAADRGLYAAKAAGRDCARRLEVPDLIPGTT